MVIIKFQSKNVQKLEPSHSAGGKMVQALWKTAQHVLKMFNTEHMTQQSHFYVYTRELTRIFTQNLHTNVHSSIINKQSESKCPSIYEQIQGSTYVNNTEQAKDLVIAGDGVGAYSMICEGEGIMGKVRQMLELDEESQLKRFKTTKTYLLKGRMCQVWWSMPVILALGKLKQEDWDLEAS